MIAIGMILTCTIIDDDQLTIDIIEHYINKTDGIELASKSNNALDAIKIIDTDLPHIVFVDVNLPGIENIEFDDIFKKGIVYVFVTRYPKGYIMDMLPDSLTNSGYLVKPVSYTLFTQEIDRIKKSVYSVS